MSLLVSILLSLLSVRGFRYTLTEEGLVPSGMPAALKILLFLLQFLILYQIVRDPDRRLKVCAGMFGLITGIFYTLGLSMDRAKTLSWIGQSRGYSLNFLNMFFTAGTLCCCFAYAVFSFLKRQEQRKRKQAPTPFSFKKVFLWWGLFLVAFIPWFLYLYPGILTQDSEDMIRQALYLKQLNNHHSVLITLALRLVIAPIVHLTGSARIGVSTFLFLQMTLTAFIFSLSFEWIRKYVHSIFLRCIFFLWLAAYPLYPIYSVTLWKDVPFSMCFLVLILCLSAIAEDEKAYFGSKRKQFRLFLTLLLIPILRHNGIAVILAISVYMLIVYKPFRRQIAVICGSALLLFGVWNQVLLPALQVETLSPSLGLSVFMQQISRTLALHTDEISVEERETLSAYFDIDDIWTRYNPLISDSVKKHFLDEVYERDPAAFFSAWAKLGIRYPLDYAEAFLHNNYGYWFPCPEDHLPYYGTYVIDSVEGLHPDPVLIFPGTDRIFQWYTSQREVPGLSSLLISPGICFWMWLLCGMYSLYRDRRKFILFLTGLVLWMTVLISPVFNEIRYVYGLFTALPPVMAVSLSSRGSGSSDDRY